MSTHHYYVYSSFYDYARAPNESFAQYEHLQLSIDTDIIPNGEQRQITLSVNVLQVSCRSSYSPSVA